MRETRAAVAAGLTGLAVCAGCTTPPSPAELASNAALRYMNALAEGYYRSACAQLDSHALASLGGPDKCRAVLSRCLPYNAQVAKRDQSQLLYATVEVRVRRSRADATVSGTAVAKAVRQLSLAKEGRHWILTSYGSAITGCVSRAKAKSVRS